MNVNESQDPTPYLEMRDEGAEPEQVFLAAKRNGLKNFECIALLCGVFNMTLDDARIISHKQAGAAPKADIVRRGLPK